MNVSTNGFNNSVVGPTGSSKNSNDIEDEDDVEIRFIEASNLYETGIRKGILGIDVDEAERAFQNSKEMVMNFIDSEATTMSFRPSFSRNKVQIKWQELLVKTLCQSSKLANLLRNELLGQQYALDGIEAHKELIRLLAKEDESSSFETDDDDDDDDTTEQQRRRIQNDILLARLYQEMTIAVSIQRSSSSAATTSSTSNNEDDEEAEIYPRFWTLKGLLLMKRLRNELTMELLPLEAKMMLGVFFSYLGYDGLSQEEKLDGCTEALQIFETNLTDEYWNSINNNRNQRNGSPPSLLCYNFYSNYVHVLSISAYIFRVTNSMDNKADQIVQEMKRICDLALTTFPNSTIYLMAKYRCCVSQSNHYNNNASNNDTTNELVSSRKRETEAGEQVCIQLGNHRTPTVYWNWVGNSFLRLAEIKAQHTTDNDNGNGNQLHLKSAMESIQKAVSYQSMCVGSYNNTSNDDTIPFYQQYDYFCSLVEAGSINSKVDGKFYESMDLYSKSFIIFSTDILHHQECNDGQREYCIWAISNAFDQCTIKDDISNNNNNNNLLKQFGIPLLQSIFEVGATVESRKSIVYYSSILKDIGTKLVERNFLTDAVDVFERILQKLNTLHESYPWHTRIAYYIGQAYLGLSEAHEQMDDTEQEAKCRRDFLRIQSALHGSNYDRWLNKENDPGVILTNDDSDVEDIPMYMESLRLECQKSPKILKLTVPCHPIGSDPSSLSSSRLDVYITEAIPGKDPIDDELRVLREDYDDVTIADDIEDSIRALHRLAVKNKVSFLQLFRYAIDTNEDDTSIRKKEEVLKTPFPKGYYNKEAWCKKLVESDDSNINLPTRAVELMADSMYSVVEIYGDFPQVVYKALGQVIDPLFDREEYTKDIVQVLVDAGKNENRPLLVNYGQSLQILRHLCFKDDDFFATHFSRDEMDALGGKEAYFDRISTLTANHIKEIRQQIADRTERHPKYLYERPIPPAVLSRVCPSSVDIEGNDDEAAEQKMKVECCICSESIGVAEGGSYMLAPCDHLFHRTCLSQWMSIKMDCPLCRANLPES